MAISAGLHWWQALLISMLTLTSAGQVASLSVIINPGRYLELLISQTTINVRYCFMSIALSQKTDSKFKGLYKWLLGFFITDEIFAVAMTKKQVSRSFFFGLGVLPYLGWALGTFVGAILGEILPGSVMIALGLAIYGMFIAIIVPPMKEDKSIIVAVVIAILFSCSFYYIPYLNQIPTGITISICAVVAALICAFLFPVKEETQNG
jgi:predicted branched-subunit amino acid permease